MDNVLTPEVQHALQLALQQRTCPGDNILFGSDRTPELEVHLRTCPACHERSAVQSPLSPEQWTDSFAQLRSLLDFPPASAPQHGQIWKLSRRLAGWAPGNRYFNPPLCLLLSHEEDSSDVTVAQIYSDRRLMREDDIWLGEGKGFAQPWNTYQIQRNDLVRLLATIDDPDGSIMARLISRRENPGRLPPPDSPLRIFREMESDLGGIISLRSSDQRALCAMLELLSDAVRLAGTLATRAKDWIWPEGAADALALITGASPRLLPLAAADGNGLHDMNVLLLSGCGESDIARHRCTITHFGVDEHGLLVRGRLPESVRRPVKLHATLHGLTGEAALDPVSGAFRVRFNGITSAPASDQFKMAIIAVA